MTVCRCSRGNLLIAFLVLTLLATALASCGTEESAARSGAEASHQASPTTSSGMDTWPVASPPPSDLSLALSKTTVRPNEVITRTILGAQNRILIGNDFRTELVGPDMMLEQNVQGNWRLLYYLGLGYRGEKPGYIRATPNIAILAVGLFPEPATIQIPNLPPGTYRLREDVEREDDLTPLPATPSSLEHTFTLYATIQVVGAVSTPVAP